MKEVIKLNKEADVKWFVEFMNKHKMKPFEPNDQLKEALKRYKLVTQQKE